MKLLLLTTTYGGVYPTFEKALANEFKKLELTLYVKPIRSFTQPEQLLKYCFNHQVDWIFTFLGYQIPRNWRPYFLKKKLPPLGLWFTEDPYHLSASLDALELATYAWTVDEAALHYYESMKTACPVAFLPLGYDPASYFAKETEPQYDLSFVGYPYPERVQLIQKVHDSLPLSIGVAGPWKQTQLPRGVAHLATWLPPSETAALYRQSKVVLNTYRPHTLPENKSTIVGESVNNRTFEIAACSAFQLSEWRPGIQRFFSQKDLTTFLKADECIEQLNDILRNETMRKKKASLSHKRAISSHTFYHRALEISKQMQLHL